MSHEAALDGNDAPDSFPEPLPSQRQPRHYSRREMLGLLALSSVGMMVPPPSDTGPSLTRRTKNASIVDEIRRRLETAFAGNDIGFEFAYLTDDPDYSFEIAIENERAYPVASSFKSGVVLYYFMTLPQDMWEYSPGTDMYSMAVYSNNLSTARVLDTVATYLNRDNPLRAYNDFARDPNMLNLQFGLYQWTFQAFYTPTNGYIDERYSPRNYAERSRSKTAGNYSSAGDLARLYRFLATADSDPRWQDDSHFKAAIEASRELLAIPAPEYVSPLERTIAYTPHYSKDGVLQAGEIDVRALSDAGVWQVADGGTYLIAYMSANVSTPRSDAALGQVAEAMRMYQRFLHPDDYHVLTAASEPVHPGSFDYGFVRETGVPLYSAPDLGAPKVNNAVRPDSIFGTTYLMHGAMVRVKALDDTWAEIERDDKWDDAFDWPVYVQLKDLQIIDREPAHGLGYVTGDAANGKLVVLDIYRRELILFEGKTAILRTPVILNTQNTPRDIAVMQRGYMTRNMPNYPGVPFTYFLHGTPYLDNGGFAIHGSPWHLWESTVREKTIMRRLTHGCINLPDWVIPIPHLGRAMRTDEFIFRWAGGFPDPANDHVHTQGRENPVRVYSVNNIERELRGYPMPDAYRAAGIYWPDVLGALRDKELDVPDVFYS